MRFLSNYNIIIILYYYCALRAELPTLNRSCDCRMEEVVQGGSREMSYVMMTSLALLAVGLSYVYHKVKYSRFYELGDKIPGPKALPLIGHAHRVWGMKSKGKWYNCSHPMLVYNTILAFSKI